VMIPWRCLSCLDEVDTKEELDVVFPRSETESIVTAEASYWSFDIVEITEVVKASMATESNDEEEIPWICWVDSQLTTVEIEGGDGETEGGALIDTAGWGDGKGDAWDTGEGEGDRRKGGDMLGTQDGNEEGRAEGDVEGTREGLSDGGKGLWVPEGARVGFLEGFMLGFTGVSVGERDGTAVKSSAGDTLGASETGLIVGCTAGSWQSR
jgi:hypothetical protein